MYYRFVCYLFIVLTPLLITGCPSVTLTPSPTKTIDSSLPTTTSTSTTTAATPTAIDTPMAIPTPTAIPAPPPKPDLSIFQTGLGSDPSMHIIKGEGFEQIEVGEDVVAYASTEVGAKIPVAVLRVVAKTKEHLEAQTIMLRPGEEVQANFPVDTDINSVGGSEMEFAPSIPADGYFLTKEQVYIQAGVNLSVGASLQTLELVKPNSKIVDAIPLPLPLLRIKSMGVKGHVAQVELIKGEWPISQTLVVALTPTPTPIVPATPLAEPTVANCISPPPVAPIILNASPVSVARLQSPVCDEVRQFAGDMFGNYLYLVALTINQLDDQSIKQIARGKQLQRLQTVVAKNKELVKTEDRLVITFDIASSYIEAIRIEGPTQIEIDVVTRAASNGRGGTIVTSGKNGQGTLVLTLIEGSWYVADKE